jgi:hypothetical protein
LESTRFDRITSTLTERQSRRGALRLLAAAVFGGGSLALLAREETEARKKRKKRNRRKKPGPARPALAAATCNDGIQNGGETGVDCGGPNCPPCEAGQTCAADRDCLTGRCGDGLGAGNTCQSCAGDGVCGSDANGGCLCDDRGVCYTDVRAQRYVDSCAACPLGWGCQQFPEITGCYPPCGSSV